MSQAQCRTVTVLHMPGEISCSVFKAERLDLMQLKPRKDITAFQTCKLNLTIKLYKLSVFWDSRSENEVGRSGGD